MADRETRTATIQLLGNGIVVTRIKPRAIQTLDDAKANVSASFETGSQMREGADRRCPLLVDIRQALPLDAETRHYYTGKQLTRSFLALGLLVNAGAFGRMFGNIYLRVANSGIPAKLFHDETEALEWLKTFLR